jgi:hypothetical protein
MPAPAAPARRGAILALAAATFLLVRYTGFDLGLPTGGAEFSYQGSPLEPLPFAALRGFTPDQLARSVGRLFILGPALVLLSVAVAEARIWALARREATGEVAAREATGGTTPRDPTEIVALAPPDLAVVTPPTDLALVAGAWSLAVTAWVMLTVLRGRPLLDEEMALRAQALLFAAGRVGAGTGPAWLTAPTAWSNTGGVIGARLFGEPLVQIPGALLGVPALLHLPLAALALAAWHRAVRGAAGPAVATWATVLLALSPLFVLTNATGLPDTSALASLAIAGLGLQLCREGRVRVGAALVGTAFGFGLAAQADAVAPFGGVLAVATLAVLVHRRRLDAAGLLALSASAWAGLVGLYDHAVTGSALTLPAVLDAPAWGFGPIGGGVDAWIHTPAHALENLAVSIVRFDGWWLGWPASLALLVVWAVVGRPAAGAAPYVLGGVALLLANAGSYSPGVSDTGPVACFPWLLPAALLGAHAIVAAGRRWPGPTAAALAVHFLVGTGTFLAENVARLDRLEAAIHDPSDAVLAAIAPPALLFVAPRTRTRGWITAPLPERPPDADDPVLVYAEPDDATAAAIRAANPARRCWYLSPTGTLGGCETRWPPAATAGAAAIPAAAPLAEPATAAP